MNTLPFVTSANCLPLSIIRSWEFTLAFTDMFVGEVGFINDPFDNLDDFQYWFQRQTLFPQMWRLK